MKNIIMAAGKGTRLAALGGKPLPKVLREANGKPLLHYVLNACGDNTVENTVIVVGYLAEEVMAAYPDYRFVRQGEDAYGTGYAVKCGMTEETLKDYHGDVMIVNGDMPLFTRETFDGLRAKHQACGAACTMLTCVAQDYFPYGRIVRDGNGQILRIVEEADCTPEEKQIKELNIGMYIFNADRLRYALTLLKNDNAKGEYYITDLPPILLAAGDKVEAYSITDQDQIHGVNTPEDLEEAGRLLKKRG